jgi:UDP-N-acetylmuramyl tripeptide synthase
MTTAVLAGAGPVASNTTGANMLDGLAQAMAMSTAPTVVAEVDELYLPEAVSQTSPCLLVLGNLSRDQLDRAGEIHRTAARLRELAAAHPDLRVVANADDPYVAYVARAFSAVVWVAAGSGWRGDAGTCPACGDPLRREGAVEWCCPGCGQARPHPAYWLETAPGGVSVLAGDRGRVPLSVQLPGKVNHANASLAVASGQALGVELPAAAAAVGTVREVAGRYRTYHVGEHRVRLILAKNPAGWAATFEMLPPPPAPVVIAVNAAEADGRDTSWLYDVCFERLAGHAVTAAGDRAAEVGVRLSYAEIPHATIADPIAAICAAPPGPLTLAADYTSFARLRRRLAEEGSTA